MQLLDHIRSVIFGMEDGLVSIWGLVVGVSVGTGDPQMVVLAGSAGAFSAALSMAAGEYLSSKAKRELQDHRIDEIDYLIKNDEKEARREIVVHYTEHGFTKEQSKKIIGLIKRKDRLKELFLDTEGFAHGALEEPVRNATYMFLSFVFAACFPILPYVLLPIVTAEPVSLVLTATMLFIVGAVKAQATNKSYVRSGLEMLFVGGLAGAVGYFVGNFF